MLRIARNTAFGKTQNLKQELGSNASFRIIMTKGEEHLCNGGDVFLAWNIAKCPKHSHVRIQDPVLERLQVLDALSVDGSVALLERHTCSLTTTCTLPT
jgi:hypothetical protein